MKDIEKYCFLEPLRYKYKEAKKKEKGAILDSVQECLELSRRQARRLMEGRNVGRPKNPGKAGRRGKYQDLAFRQSLKEVWKKMHFVCSRIMKAGMPEWLHFIEEDRSRPFREDINQRLRTISPATIDRILKPWKAQKGKSLTCSGGFRDEIPIQQGEVWNITTPGFLEADTAAHCGGSVHGQYINSLMMVDIATLWTEARAVFGKGSTPIVLAIEDVENFLPFDIKGYDSDNGKEVLNHHVLNYFQNERIERKRSHVAVTRSREYQKNDNAHVEQRNDSVARKWLGYERLDFQQLQPLVNHYYKYVLCPLLNHFFPSFKLVDKIRIKSRSRRIYKDPMTPYARIMNSAYIPDKRKEILQQLHLSLNPVTLSKEEKKLRTQIDAALKALRKGQLATGLLMVPSPPAFFTDYENNNVKEIGIFPPTVLPLYKTGT